MIEITLDLYIQRVAVHHQLRILLQTCKYYNLLILHMANTVQMLFNVLTLLMLVFNLLVLLVILHSWLTFLLHMLGLHWNMCASFGRLLFCSNNQSCRKSAKYVFVA